MTHPLDTVAAGVPLSARLHPVCDTTTGIYCIWMPSDPKHRVYVGQAGKGVSLRISAHRAGLRAGNHHTSKLQRAFNKYGEGAFVWALVEEVPRDRDALTVAEQAWMDIVELERLFNTAPAAGSTLGVGHSDATREVLAALATARMMDPKVRAALSASAKDQWSDPEYRAANTVRQKIAHGTPERRASAAAISTARNSTPEARAAQSARQTAKWADAEFRATKLASLKVTHTSPEFRAAVSARAKKQMATVEGRAAILSGAQAYWANPESRAAAAAHTRARMNARTPEQVAAFVAKRKATLAAKQLAAQADGE